MLEKWNPSIVTVAVPSVLKRITADLIGFLLMLLPSFLTLYLMDEMIEAGNEIPYYWVALVIAASALIHLFSYYFVSYQMQVFANELAADLGRKIGNKIASSRVPEYEAQSKSKILNMMQMDVSSIYTLSNYLIAVPADIVRIVVVLALLFSVHYTFALMAIVLAPFYVMSSYMNKRKLEKLVNEERQAADSWMQETEAIINGKVSIGLNHVFPYIMKRFEQKLTVFYQARNRQHFYLLITKELPQLITTMAPLLILIIGGNLVIGGKITLGTLVFAMQLVGYIFSPMASIASIRAEMMSIQPVFKRGRDFISLPDESDEAFGEVSADGRIVIQDITILRPDYTTLFEIEHFEAPATGLVLIKGENGSGKSTLFNLLSGVFAKEQIQIHPGGMYSIPADMKEKLGYLYYPNFIIPGTVKENVICGRDISEAEYAKAEALLNLPPAKKQVIVRPENLSLGEKQKIYLARLLLGGYKYLLLDEPGSNLDVQTEENLVRMLLELKQTSMVLVISHNQKYDEIADRIYTISNGKLI
ncbi:MAG: ABC transporter ATP-binding protein/permease [Lachnospiraceae bacterium]|nr:ABC transporter ATP-binding protein/permease [Lachnospiraceae bacterium]